MDLLVAALVGAAVGGVAALGFGRWRRSRAAAELARRARERALRAGAAAAESERATTARILGSMHEGVVLFGADGATTYANPAAERHLGTIPSSVEGLLPVPLRDAVRRSALTGLREEAEAETGTPRRWLRATATPVGEDAAVLLVLRDVTEARRLDAVRRDFVANASHELKTPVASILAAAETIATAATEDPAAVPAFAARLERDALRLSRIVSDLLDLSRLESGSEIQSSVDLEAVVREEVDRAMPAATDAGVGLSVRGEPAKVAGSPRDLALLARNLVENAVRSTPSGGEVSVRVRLEDEEAVLEVEDNGVGIPSRDLPRIFERFYRVDRARSRETGGTGLGLAIVRHVVENHGGTIAVRSELGRGTHVEVRLPAAV
jgi:signal transduction histidine kinase